MLKRFTDFLLVGCLFLTAFANQASSAERPNFLWILSEDNSKHYLELFDETGTPTPNIKKLAEQGVLYERAFSCSPVCSVARTTLITGVYAPRIGTQFHRKIQPVKLPEDWQLFPAYLRDAGYYTTNNSKEDYNTVKQNKIWDESSRRASWTKRPSPDTPFFHMQSFPASHESRLHFSKKVMENQKTQANPEQVELADYHPETPTFRYTHARYHDRIGVIDDLVGEMVAELKKAGELENTFIFYFGDHGGVLPRSKGYIYESGLHVPLVVRVPENFRHLVKMPAGSRTKGFVSFVDFGPTLLHLAGQNVPEHMDGEPILGPKLTLETLNQRDEAFGYADRFDEKYDFCRSLRKGRYKYVRNYQSYYPDGLQNNYRYRMLAFQEWRSLFREGKLDPVERQFFEAKDAECLYDLKTDPHETKNLAGDPEYQSVLKELRGKLSHRVKNLPDLSFYPETVLVEEAVSKPIAFGQAHKQKIGELEDIADLSLLEWDEAKPKISAALTSSNPWNRYWAATVCGTFGQQAAPLAKEVKPLLSDDELLVRVRAAEFLGSIKAGDPRTALMSVLRESESPVTTLIALNAVVFLRDFHGYKFEIQPENVRAKSSLVNRRLDYLLGKL